MYSSVPGHTTTQETSVSTWKQFDTLTLRLYLQVQGTESISLLSFVFYSHKLNMSSFGNYNNDLLYKNYYENEHLKITRNIVSQIL